MYRPNFCADCGARIARARWHLWTSRRFCAGCEQRDRGKTFVWPLLLTVALFGGGFFAGRAGRAPAPPLVVERGELPALPEPPAQPRSAPRATTEPAAASAAAVVEPRAAAETDGEREPPTDPQETISMCGARTQRGTPCSRRVRGTGRCWQHRGLPAMLPPARLIIPPE